MAVVKLPSAEPPKVMSIAELTGAVPPQLAPVDQLSFPPPPVQVNVCASAELYVSIKNNHNTPAKNTLLLIIFIGYLSVREYLPLGTPNSSH